MNKPLFFKDPSASLDYSVDWSAWLGQDTIVTSTWTVPTGITAQQEATTATVATIWLTGGTVGTNYLLVNRITTAGGRMDERTIKISVREQ